MQHRKFNFHYFWFSVQISYIGRAVARFFAVDQINRALFAFVHRLKMNSLLIVYTALPLVLGEVFLIKPEEEAPLPPPKPYAFGYAAGRFPGNIDRTHSEVSDGAGTVQGSFSYVDPRHQIRTVDYIADKNGFHPVTNYHVPDLPSDTPAVAAAKARHLLRYAAIAHQHQEAPNRAPTPVDTAAVRYAKSKHLALFEKIAAEHARLAAEAEAAKSPDGEGAAIEAYKGNYVL
ncbi:unnamed protein product [Phyllotreta striolata]|uniref:Uncharacterized protein n=1 Tax=Phyllotreta striolata TaxID=444603 RepID=A0A9N9TTR5_PHYSR|nr:unnamed protein product [Phyllotreta striolata]